jgi:small subunit ribosomal protein S15
MASSDNFDLSVFRLHEKDTGSADVQIALLTRRINQLTDHLKIFRKDRYKSVIEKLNLRK